MSPLILSNNSADSQKHLVQAWERTLDGFFEGAKLTNDQKIDVFTKAIEKKDFLSVFYSDPILFTSWKELVENLSTTPKQPGLGTAFLNDSSMYNPLLLSRLTKFAYLKGVVACSGMPSTGRPDTIMVDDEVIRLNFHRNWGKNIQDNRPYIETIIYGATGKYVRLYCLVDSGADYTMLSESIVINLGYDLSKATNLSIVNASGVFNNARLLENVDCEVCGKRFSTSCIIAPNSLPLLGRGTLLRSMDFGFNIHGWFGFRK